MTALREGAIVTYDSPSWGRCRGRVLRIVPEQAGREVLVQDLGPDGGREWWPLAEVEVEPEDDYGPPDDRPTDDEIEAAQNAYERRNDWRYGDGR